jgi:hypothetical protein
MLSKPFLVFMGVFMSSMMGWTGALLFKHANAENDAMVLVNLVCLMAQGWVLASQGYLWARNHS